MTGSILSGICLLTASYFMASYSAWTSNTLTGLGVTVFLLAPGSWISYKIQTRVDRVTEVAVAAQNIAESAKSTSERTAAGLADIEERIVAEQIRVHGNHLDIYRRVLTDHSRASVIAALHRATEEQILSPHLVLSRVWETDLYYRFLFRPNDDFLQISLEKLSGVVLATHEWRAGVSPEDFYALLVTAVRDAGADLGVGLNLPTESVRHLAEMLVRVADLRSQEMSGYRHTLKNLVKADGTDGDGWYFTETAVIPRMYPSYEVDYTRLDELDWSDHLRGKGWSGADLALADAIVIDRRLRSGELVVNVE